MTELASSCKPCRCSRRYSTGANTPACRETGDRRRSTRRLRCPARNSRSWIRLVEPFCPHKHWYCLARSEAKSSVSKHRQDGRNLTRVARHGQPCRIIVAEHLVKHDLGAGCLAGGIFARGAIPVWILLRKAGLELPGGQEIRDMRAVGATVACVYANSLPEKFLYGRSERPARGEINISECNVGGVETSPQWRGVT